MNEKSTPPEGSGWAFVAHSTIGDVEACTWHRQGTNEFGWSPVGKCWGAARMTSERPVTDFIKILVPQFEQLDTVPLLVNDV